MGYQVLGIRYWVLGYGNQELGFTTPIIPDILSPYNWQQEPLFRIIYDVLST